MLQKQRVKRHQSLKNVTNSAPDSRIPDKRETLTCGEPGWTLTQAVSPCQGCHAGPRSRLGCGGVPPAAPLVSPPAGSKSLSANRDLNTALFIAGVKGSDNEAATSLI